MLEEGCCCGECCVAGVGGAPVSGRGQVLLCGEGCVAGVRGSSVAGRCQRGRCEREGCDGECDEWRGLVEIGVGAHLASPLA